jgi:hypothetical protein
MLYMIFVKNSLLLCHLKTLAYDHLEFVRDKILVVTESLNEFNILRISKTQIMRVCAALYDKTMRLLYTGPFILICFQLRSSSILTMGKVHITSFRERERPAICRAVEK